MLLIPDRMAFTAVMSCLFLIHFILLAARGCSIIWQDAVFLSAPSAMNNAWLSGTETWRFCHYRKQALPPPSNTWRKTIELISPRRRSRVAWWISVASERYLQSSETSMGRRQWLSVFSRILFPSQFITADLQCLGWGFNDVVKCFVWCSLFWVFTFINR